jgi:hypothetical protein
VGSTLSKLGIRLSAHTVSSIAAKEQGVAATLLYSVKQAIANLNRDLRVRLGMGV